MDVTTFEAIKTVMDGTFEGGVTSVAWRTAAWAWPLSTIWTLPVSAELKAELEQIQAGVIAKDISANVEDYFLQAPEGFKACQVTDTGGIDDKSFNATAWKGIQDAMARFGIEGKYLESQQQTDYEKNIKAFIDEGCESSSPSASCWAMPPRPPPKPTRSSRSRSSTTLTIPPSPTSWGRSSTPMKPPSWLATWPPA